MSEEENSRRPTLADKMQKELDEGQKELDEIKKKQIRLQIQQATNNFIIETMDELLAFREDLEKQYKKTVIPEDVDEKVLKVALKNLQWSILGHLNSFFKLDTGDDFTLKDKIKKQLINK